MKWIFCLKKIKISRIIHLNKNKKTYLKNYEKLIYGIFFDAKFHKHKCFLMKTNFLKTLKKIASFSYFLFLLSTIVLSFKIINCIFNGAQFCYVSLGIFLILMMITFYLISLTIKEEENVI